MPAWAGKWKGGRWYFDTEGRRVFFIERRGRTVKLDTHDAALAVGQLAAFLADPVAFCRPPVEPASTGPVLITDDRVKLYLDSIAHTVEDHRRARRGYLGDWADLGVDLRNDDRHRLRVALASFDGGHRGRAEALNAFARWLVREGELERWVPVVNTRAPRATRAAREAYSIDQLVEAYTRIEAQPLRDLLLLRASTGLHHTEVEQLVGCKTGNGPLPPKGVALRVLPAASPIAGVLQVVHKSRRIHRQSLDASSLAAALRLRERVPDRTTVWEAFAPLTPSNLRHTFTTLAGECGELVTFQPGGVDRARVAQTIGHRAGSTMTADRYEKIQVPPLIKLPIPWPGAATT